MVTPVCPSKLIECLECGFFAKPGETVCRKCDAKLFEQSHGNTVTIDIAHHGETVVVATGKLERAIKKHRELRTGTLVVVTGMGAIREAVEALLRSAKAGGRIGSFRQEPWNPGAFLVGLSC
jgi:hypothetical protein